MREQEAEKPTKWTNLLGPVYEASNVASKLNLSLEQLSESYRKMGFLGCVTRDGTLVFPTFQFDLKPDKNWGLVDGLAEIVSVFTDVEISDWTLAGWFVTPQEEFKGQTIIQHLRNGKGTETPLVLARNLAEIILNPPVA